MPPNGPYFGWCWLGYTVSVPNDSPEQVPIQFTPDSGTKLIMDTKKPEPGPGFRVTSDQQLGLRILATKLEISIDHNLYTCIKCITDVHCTEHNNMLESSI